LQLAKLMQGDPPRVADIDQAKLDEAEGAGCVSYNSKDFNNAKKVKADTNGGIAGLHASHTQAINAKFLVPLHIFDWSCLPPQAGCTRWSTSSAARSRSRSPVPPSAKVVTPPRCFIAFVQGLMVWFPMGNLDEAAP
jgi:hypothetical protein